MADCSRASCDCLERLGRVFHRLLGVLVPGLVVFLAVMRRGNAMRVRGKLVHLSGSLVFESLAMNAPLNCRSNGNNLRK